MDDKFNAILNDPEKMKAAFDMASKIMAQGGSKAPAPEINSNDLGSVLQNMRENGTLDSILKNLSSTSSSSGTQSTDNTKPDAKQKSNFADMLPNLLQMMGGSASLDSDKANLLKAIKPYVNESRAENIDRAVNVAGMAKSAKNMLGSLKR